MHHVWVALVIALLGLAGAARATAQQCGNGIVETGEDCDDGGTCIGGTNAGTGCSSESECFGNGICVGGIHRGAACASDATCPGGSCLHCVPRGGDGCAANCTFEHDVPYPLVAGQVSGLNVVPGTSAAVLISDILSIALPVGGICTGGSRMNQSCTTNAACPGATCTQSQEVLTVGSEKDGTIPLVVKAASIKFAGVPISTLACECTRGLVAKTCGGTFFESDGVTPSTECTPGFVLGDPCVGKAPCAFVHGDGNAASGEIGCDGLDGVDALFEEDSGGSSGACAPPNACPPLVHLSGHGGPGSAVIAESLLNIAAFGACTGSDPSKYGPDGTFCTADDPPGGFSGFVGRGTAPGVTGVATGVVHNANGVNGSDLGPVTATGAPFSCSELAQGSAAGGGLATAFTYVHVATFGDEVLTAQLFAGVGLCGNGVLDPGEECDDHNHTNGDGCGSACRIEPCFTCTGQPSTCTPVSPGTACPNSGPCSLGTCDADGTCTQTAVSDGTACDNGSFCDGADTCSNGTCSAHSGDPCAGQPECANVCNELARTCVVPDGTQCIGSDPNPCMNACVGATCEPGTPVTHSACCGNGILDPGEQCEDGNVINDDGCDATCTFSSGFTPPFTQCPAIGAGTGCQVLLNVTASGAVNVLVDQTQPGFDSDDTLIGLQNSSTQTVTGISLSSFLPIFAFDFEGLCNTFGAPVGCPFGPTGYEGPGVVFGPHSLTSGAVYFPAGIPPGGSAYFSLEEAISWAQLSAQLNLCGNGTLDAGEQCDDGNFTDNDGCDSNCTPTGCGNGVVTGAEQCDDGNLIDADGCDSNCTYTGCGNGVLTFGEQCDDGNLVDGDGCDSNCTPTGCGNSVVTAGEQCDDGNLSAGDGCDASCTTEPGWTCPLPGYPCAFCGNGFIEIGEQCDDGNLVSGDGCDSNCTFTGCGNGIVTAGEQCDDGNFADGDGCDSNCTFTACGNGVLTAGEQCDDGNFNAGDGCDTSCISEAGWICPLPGAPCRPVCGDGLVVGGEPCDDGNLTDGDGCDSNCTLTGCGNGIVTPSTNEQCDDGNTVNNDGCSATCQLERCGDGIIQALTPPLTLSFSWLATSCADPMDIEFTLNGRVALHTLADAGTCDCFPGIHTVQVTDPGVLALLRPGPATFTVELIGNTAFSDKLLSWALATIQDGTATRDVVIVDASGGARQRDTDLCDGYEESLTERGPVYSLAVPGLLGEQCDDGNLVDGDGCSSTCEYELDHFQCYKGTIVEKQPPIAPVTLADGLTSFSAHVRGLRELCTPTNKNGETPAAVPHPDHLESYTITPEQPKLLRQLLPLRNRTVTNQFGTLRLDVLWPNRLLVPTAKSLTGIAPAPGSPVVDHFTCYKVKRTKGAPAFVPIPDVTVADQFGPGTVTVGRPKRLCLPANKNNEAPGAESHSHALLCYHVRGGFRSIGRVFTNNQFGAGIFYPHSRDELCVPSVISP